MTEYGLNTSSRDIYDAVTNNDLLWGNLSHTNWHGEPLLTTEMNGGPVPLRSPGKLTYSSAHHLDYRAYPDDSPDSLMTSGRSSAVTVKGPGPVTLAMLYDMGWELSDAGWEVIETGRPPPPPAVPPMPEIELDVTERGGWNLILVRWDDLPSADHFRDLEETDPTPEPLLGETILGTVPHRSPGREL